MAGRIRTIKPEWLDDERLVSLSPAARVLSVALILMADDYGNGRASLVMTAAKVFPFQADSLGLTTAAMAELEAIAFVVLWECDGQTYFHVRNWDKHQRIDKRGSARVDPPPENLNHSGLLRKIRGTFVDSSKNVRDVLATDLDLDLDLDLDHDQENPGSPAAPEPSTPPPPPLASAAPDGPAMSGASQVWDRYLAGWHRIHGTRGRPPKLDDKRRRLVRARLRDFDVDTLGLAADGIWRSDWHVQAGQTSFDLAMRDSAHVERFALLGQPGAPPPVQRETLTPRDPEPNPRLEAHMARMVAEGRDTPMPANPLQALLAMASKPPTAAPGCHVAASWPPSTPREASVGLPTSPAGDQPGAA